MSVQSSRRAALLTGSAGQLGEILAEHLTSQGKNIIGLYRTKLPKAHKFLLPLCCDLKDTNSIVAPLKSTDTVIHLAWEGGVAGASSQKSTELTERDVQNSVNVQITRNIIAAMEKAKSRRIIFISWLGAERYSASRLHREKYWAENLILNSDIPEKIIIRCGVIGSNIPNSDFERAALSFAKVPLILPLPRELGRVVLTTIKDFIQVIDSSLLSMPKNGNHCQIIDLCSTNPASAAKVFDALEHKKWGKRRLQIGGVVGNLLFHWIERRFGVSKNNEPKLIDFFEAGQMPERLPAKGLPSINLGIEFGQKSDLINAL